MFIPVSLNFAFDSSLKDDTILPTSFATSSAPFVFIFPTEFINLERLVMLELETLTPFKVLIALAMVPISFENLRIPEMSFVNAVLIDLSEVTNLSNDLAA